MSLLYPTVIPTHIGVALPPDIDTASVCGVDGRSIGVTPRRSTHGIEPKLIAMDTDVLPVGSAFTYRDRNGGLRRCEIGTDGIPRTA